jgi:hypothetical protein
MYYANIQEFVNVVGILPGYFISSPVRLAYFEVV